jgi:hypothetical protein
MQPGSSQELGGNLQLEVVFEEELSRCSLAAQQELGGNLQVEAVSKRSYLFPLSSIYSSDRQLFKN